MSLVRREPKVRLKMRSYRVTCGLSIFTSRFPTRLWKSTWVSTMVVWYWMLVHIIFDDVRQVSESGHGSWSRVNKIGLFVFCLFLFVLFCFVFTQSTDTRLCPVFDFCQHFSDLYLRHFWIDFNHTWLQVLVHHPIYVIWPDGGQSSRWVYWGQKKRNFHGKCYSFYTLCSMAMWLMHEK